MCIKVSNHSWNRVGSLIIRPLVDSSGVSFDRCMRTACARTNRGGGRADEDASSLSSLQGKVFVFCFWYNDKGTLLRPETPMTQNVHVIFLKMIKNSYDASQPHRVLWLKPNGTDEFHQVVKREQCAAEYWFEGSLSHHWRRRRSEFPSCQSSKLDKSQARSELPRIH